jgi:16S rRNA (adenine1518-N6/adenine1519-N6)-dimethyltransferase
MLKKKSLGQNFLKSETALDAMVDAGDPNADDIILEIGPGEGVLTERLLKFAGKVIAIEKDSRLISFLKEKFDDQIVNGKLDILEKDILDFDEKILEFYKHPYKIIANIPYYITGQVIRKFLEAKNQPESMTLLVQKEVAERIVAKTARTGGDNKESLLSLSVKVFGKPEYVRTVGRGAFTPQPNVDSAIIHISDISRKNFVKVNEKKFFELIHAGFAHKRKQLLPNLSNLYEKDYVLEALKKCGLDSKCRAEDVSINIWLELCKTL